MPTQLSIFGGAAVEAEATNGIADSTTKMTALKYPIRLLFILGSPLKFQSCHRGVHPAILLE